MSGQPRPGSIEAFVYERLDDELGHDRRDISLAGYPYSRRQVSAALSRLHAKGLIHGSRWRETFVWFRRDRRPELDVAVERARRLPPGAVEEPARAIALLLS